ncbi:MAG: DMT family transporter [Pseudomonadota bacterium]
MKGLSALFVIIWSTGFVVGRCIVPVASPNLFLTARFILAALLFTSIALITGARWPKWREWPTYLLNGVMLNGIYLAGGYWAVAHGLLPAAMALLGAIQPIFTALISIALVRQLPGAQFWYGLVAGLVGVLLVLFPSLKPLHSFNSQGIYIMIGLLSVLSLTIGTMLQKTSDAQVDICASLALQNVGAALFTGILAYILQESHWQPGFVLYGSLAWASFVLSGLGTGLLVWLVRNGQVTKFATLMYLAPPLAALESYALFGSHISPVQIAGFIVALLGVLLCYKEKTKEVTKEKTPHAT